MGGRWVQPCSKKPSKSQEEGSVWFRLSLAQVGVQLSVSYVNLYSYPWQFKRRDRLTREARVSPFGPWQTPRKQACGGTEGDLCGGEAQAGRQKAKGVGQRE